MNRLTRAHALAIMVLSLLIAATLRLPNLPDAPPGLHYDEAANGLLAADIGLGGERPVFIPSYTGKEVLFFYLAGATMRLVGESVFALRLTAALVGLLTVAATYWLGREMLADRRMAILAAALLAISFWHVLFSRLGFRAVTQPLLQALAVAALFRGLRRDQARWLAVGGVCLGLTAYTYLAARIFPILLLASFLPLIFSRNDRPLRWRQLAWFGSAAVLTLAPLLFYFFRNPDAFWVRIGQVAPGTGAPGLALWQSLLKSWGMIFVQGDPFWRFNIPGRPLFNWVWGGLLVVGWIVLIIRYRRFPYDWQRSAVALLILTPLVMILPTALATNELVPSNLRAIGMIPFIFFLPAVGLVILLHDIERRFNRPTVTFAVLFVALLLLLSGGLATWQAYFDEWAAEETLFFENDGDLATVARFLDQLDYSSTTVYVAAPHYRHPTVAFLSDAYEQVKWLPDAAALVLPAEGSATFVYPFNSPAPDWAMPILDHGQRQEAEFANIPNDAFRAYELSKPSSISIEKPLAINFGNVLVLRGYEIGGAEAGEELPLTLVWEVRGQPESNIMPFVHLEDEWGHRWSQVESFAYPTEQWEIGDTIIQHVPVPVPVGTPPGNYRLRVGLFDPATDEQVARLDQQGRYNGNAYFIENVPVEAGQQTDEDLQPPFPVEEMLSPAGLRLLGYERGGSSVETGASWGVAFWWEATEALPHLTSVIELISEDGSAQTLLETQPAYNTYPFEVWQTPQFVIDRQILTLPPDFEPGEYSLQLRLVDGEGSDVGSVELGPLQVEATDHLFTQPTYEEPVRVKFGNEIELLGYEMSAEGDGDYRLVLVWEALSEPTRDYTVFVHVLDTEGRCCVWQQDAMPQQDGYATSRWLLGEFVEDSYLIQLPDGLAPGEYQLEVGLYIAESGQRLTATGGDGLESDRVLLQPIVIPQR